MGRIKKSKKYQEQQDVDKKQKTQPPNNSNLSARKN